MAVPKKKTSKSKTRSRRASSWTLDAAPKSRCAQCGAMKVPHRACQSCGYYRGRQVIDV